MKRSIRMFMFLLSLLSIVSGCRRSNPVVSDPIDLSDSYYPLKLGNAWDYTSMIPTFAEFRFSRHVVAERTFANAKEFDIVDSTFNAGFPGYVNKYTLVKTQNVIAESNGLWLVNFDAKADDGNARHGFVQSHSDTSSVPAGLFRDVVRIYYPAAAFDGMPVEDYALNIGLLRSLPHGVPMHLTRAVVNGKVYK